MAEQLLLDPVAEDATNVELDVMAGAYGVSAMSFSAPPLDLVTVSSVDTDGAIVSARGDQNRSVQLTVEVAAASQTALDAAVATLEAKVAKLRRFGGTLRRVRADGTFRTADVLAADSYDKVMDTAYMVGNLAVCQISLVCKPLFRAPEVALSVHTETTLPYLAFTETGITGDVPALGRLVITNASTIAQRFVVWGIESRYYNAAALFFEGESTGTGAASPTVDAACSGGNTAHIVYPGSTAWTDDILISTTLRGRYRMLVRAKASATTVGFRAKWAAAGSEVTAIGSVIDYPLAAAQYTILDLGLMTIGSPRSATAILNVQTSMSTGQTADIDYVLLVPVAEGSGQAYGSTVVPLSGSGNVFNAHIMTIGPDRAEKGPRPSGDFGPFQVYEGDYLRVPVGGTVRFIVKGSQGNPYDSTSANDAGVSDDISAQLFYTPQYLGMT